MGLTHSRRAVYCSAGQYNWNYRLRSS